jgi:hypothetical protein
MQSPGWAQSSYFALVRALDSGTPVIDPYHWETKDKSWIKGHFYSVKAPGLPLLVLPAYSALDSAGFSSVSERVANRVVRDGVRVWYVRPAPLMNAGFDRARSKELPLSVARTQTMIWALGLIGSLIPALLIMLLTRSAAERVQSGTGALSSLALGLGTLLLPFSVQLMGHVLGALLLFGAFLLLWRERRGPPSLGFVGAAGLLTGLAVTVEYPMAFGGVAVGIYCVSRAGRQVGQFLARGTSFAVGGLVGSLPVGLYNNWAFGNPGTMSYSAAVATQGRTGHEKLGLNDTGFFGIGVPQPHNLIELLLAPRGLLTCTPIVLAALWGVGVMYRSGHRAEARTIFGIAAIYLLYVSGYWLPFGGGTPGPRFLIPALPFIALGLPFAFKRIPTTTLALAVPSAVVMTAATVTFPLGGADQTWRWWTRIADPYFQQTVFTAFGMGHGYRAIAPTVLLLLAAWGLGAAATFGLRFGSDWKLASGALAGWVAVATLLSSRINEHAGDEVLEAAQLPWTLIWIAAATAIVACGIAALVTRAGGRHNGLDAEAQPSL